MKFGTIFVMRFLDWLSREGADGSMSMQLSWIELALVVHLAGFPHPPEGERWTNAAYIAPAQMAARVRFIRTLVRALSTVLGALARF